MERHRCVRVTGSLAPACGGSGSSVNEETCSEYREYGVASGAAVSVASVAESSMSGGAKARAGVLGLLH